MSGNGFVKIYRQMTSWEWYTDANTMRLFMHLLLTVNYKPERWRGIEVPRGARCASIRILSKELKLSERSVRTAVAHLKETGEINVETKTGEYSIITVCNFDGYQKNDTLNDTLTDTPNDTLNDTPFEPVNNSADCCASKVQPVDNFQQQSHTDTLNDTQNDTLTDTPNDTPPTHLNTFLKRNKEYKEDEEVRTYRRARAREDDFAEFLDEPDEDDSDRLNVIDKAHGNVMLSENQIADLLERLTLDEFNEYVDRLGEFIERKGARVRDHYATIIKWVEQDRRRARSGSG